MASTQLDVVGLSMNELTSDVAAIVNLKDSSTNAYIDANGVDASKLLLHVNYTGSNNGAKVKITDGAYYSGGAQGDLILTDVGADTFYVGPFETARFKDSDGYINIVPMVDSSTSFMSVRAILLP